MNDTLGKSERVDKNSESKTSSRRLKPSERQAAAMELKLAGKSYRTIARKLDFRGPSGAHKAVAAYLRKTLTAPSEELRKIELERLDRLQVIAWKRVTVSADLKAISTVLKIMERRSKLLGLDAPTLFSLQDIENLAAKVVRTINTEVSDELARARIFNALGFADLESEKNRRQ